MAHADGIASRIGWVVLAFILAVAPNSAFSSDTVVYDLTYELTQPDRVNVRIELPMSPSGERIFVMPRAIPMGYSEVPYDRFVERMRAFATSGAPVPVRREAGSRWRLGSRATTLRRIEYSVNVATMERELLAAADSSKIRAGYVGLLGYSVFGYVDGLEAREIKLSVTMPEEWPVLSTLAPQMPPSKETTHAKAANFYMLADSQIVAGPAVSIRRLKGRVPLFLALYAETDADLTSLGTLIEETMSQVVDYYASVPFEHYTIHYELLRPISNEHEYGFSMEHMDSCTIFLDVDGAITPSSSGRDKLRTRYNLAHHFAHSWIPKRSYGSGYFPFSWEHAPIIDTIWLSEGFVQYAAVEMITEGLSNSERQRIRSRLIDRRFRRTLAETPEFIRRLSLIDLSRAASTKYSEDFRYGRNVFSRGALMAMEMDDLIRERSGGDKSLRDALRHLVAWTEHERRAFAIAELPLLFSEATGVDVTGVMERWLKPPTDEANAGTDR